MKTLVLKIKAKHLIKANEYWCDKCAIGIAYRDVMRERAYKEIGTDRILDRNGRKIWDFPEYIESRFLLDRRKAKKSHPNTIIRKITLSKSV